MVYVEIATVVLLILLNGFFSMSELAVVSSRRVRLQQMAEDGRRGARTALELQEDPSRFLSAVQIGITLIGIVAGAFGSATLAERLGPVLDALPLLVGYGHAVAVALVVMVITYLSLIAGELVPKRVALNNAEGIAVVAAPIMKGLSTGTAPLVWLLGASTEAMLRLLRVPEKRDTSVTEEEVKSLIAEGTASGVFEPEEKKMIEGVLRLSDRTVRSIMTPRLDVMWLDAGDTLEVVRREIAESGHSRFPVCRGDLEEVVGIVHAKDLLDSALAGRKVDLAAASRPALIVHDGTLVMKLLDLFRSQGQHMAVVVDEYGSVEGIVTVTDILEAIAGDLPEFGDDADADLVQRPDGSLLMDGRMPVDEAEQALGLKGLRDQGDYHTLAGFILFRFGHLPTAGEAVEHDGWRFEVVDMDGRRIDKILATRQAPPEP
ncbi:MAG TPA: hemolysin family protein [Azospirillaceae bacterium]|nr:hemolysin family protein [Azospirillaceae bacterium]